MKSVSIYEEILNGKVSVNNGAFGSSFIMDVLNILWIEKVLSLPINH